MPGLPNLNVRFEVYKHVEAGTVENVHLDWTPSAAGPWRSTVRHDLSKSEPEVDEVSVSGPIGQVDFQVPAPVLERGNPATVSVVLLAPQGVAMDGLWMTTVRAPIQGVISIDDLLSIEPVQPAVLEPGVPATVELSLTPRAAGSYELYLVVKTPEGPSVHNVGSLVVDGAHRGWILPWLPTLGISLLALAQVLWRRR